VERRRAQLEESVTRYLSQLDTADRQEPTEALAAKVTRLTEKLTKLKEQMGKLAPFATATFSPGLVLPPLGRKVHAQRIKWGGFSIFEHRCSHVRLDAGGEVGWPPRIRSASGSNACTNREAARQLRSRAG
jgi:hypothetical protein